MLYYKDHKWNISTEKVRYTQHGREITQYVGCEGKGWWVDFAEKWQHTSIIEFIPITPTQEYIARLVEINELNISEGFQSICSDYVENGTLNNDVTSPLWNLRVKKEQEMQDGYLLDLDFRQSLTEMGV